MDKKKEVISNQILAGIVMVAALISLSGTYIIYQGIKDVTYDVSYGGISGSITGFAAGKANVSIPAQAAISLPVDAINFGSLGVNQSNDTSDDSPGPFIIQNDGTVSVDLTVEATDLFTGTGASNPSDHYQFKSAENEAGSVPAVNSTYLVTDWTDVPASAEFFAKGMKFATVSDSLQGEIKITVPGDEPSGSKSSTVTFTASQS